MHKFLIRNMKLQNIAEVVHSFWNAEKTKKN